MFYWLVFEKCLWNSLYLISGDPEAECWIHKNRVIKKEMARRNSNGVCCLGNILAFHWVRFIHPDYSIGLSIAECVLPYQTPWPLGAIESPQHTLRNLDIKHVFEHIVLCLISSNVTFENP